MVKHKLKLLQHLLQDLQHAYDQESEIDFY